MNKNCIYYCDKYIEKTLIEVEGCSKSFSVHQAVFPFFNHLETYFPDAYKHMLKILEIQDEDN